MVAVGYAKLYLRQEQEPVDDGQDQKQQAPASLVFPAMGEGRRASKSFGGAGQKNIMVLWWWSSARMVGQHGVPRYLEHVVGTRYRTSSTKYNMAFDVWKIPTRPTGYGVQMSDYTRETNIQRAKKTARNNMSTCFSNPAPAPAPPSPGTHYQGLQGPLALLQCSNVRYHPAYQQNMCP